MIYRFLCLCACFGLWGSSWAADPGTRKTPAPEGPPEIQARSALLYDPIAQKIIFQKNPDTHCIPASTVKMMTALVVFETKGLNGNVLIQPEDTHVEPSHVPLQNGETVPVLDLVRALLIGSDNDTAMALARHAGGSTSRFVNLMNLRARQLGCDDTLFQNPNGLPASNQYTTARDLLKIFQRVIAIYELRQIMRTKSFYLTTRVGTQLVKNHNKLLGLYPGMGPAKTGWTYASRHTYAAAATRNSRELHLIILNSQDKWSDAKRLFDYGFSHLPSLPAPTGSQANTTVPAKPAS